MHGCYESHGARPRPRSASTGERTGLFLNSLRSAPQKEGSERE